MSMSTNLHINPLFTANPRVSADAFSKRANLAKIITLVSEIALFTLSFLTIYLSPFLGIILFPAALFLGSKGFKLGQQNWKEYETLSEYEKGAAELQPMHSDSGLNNLLIRDGLITDGQRNLTGSRFAYSRYLFWQTKLRQTTQALLQISVSADESTREHVRDLQSVYQGNLSHIRSAFQNPQTLRDDRILVSWMLSKY